MLQVAKIKDVGEECMVNVGEDLKTANRIDVNQRISNISDKEQKTNNSVGADHKIAKNCQQ